MNSADPLKIVFFTLEFRDWNSASHWAYPQAIGIADALESQGAEVTFVPVFSVHGPVETRASCWSRHIPALLKGQKFDQIWFEDVHSYYSDELMEWISAAAPVRVAFICESLKLSPAEFETRREGALRREANSRRNLSMATHVIALDETDVEDFNRAGKFKALWYAGNFIPPDCIAPPSRPPTSATALFYGTVYEERRGWLEHPSLQGLLVRPQASLEWKTTVPQRFEQLFRDGERYLLSSSSVSLEALRLFVTEMRALRKKGFLLWLRSLQEGSALVNLPQPSLIIPGRIGEGMAVGRPMVTWEMPGRPRSRALFKEDSEILFYQANDPESLAAVLHRLRQDPEWADAVGEGGRQATLKRHTTGIFGETALHWIRTGEEIGASSSG